MAPPIVRVNFRLCPIGSPAFLKPSTHVTAIMEDTPYPIRPWTSLDNKPNNDWVQLMQYLCHKWGITYEDITDVAWHHYLEPCYDMRPLGGQVMVEDAGPMCLHLLSSREALAALRICRIHFHSHKVDSTFSPVPANRPTIYSTVVKKAQYAPQDLLATLFEQLKISFSDVREIGYHHSGEDCESAVPLIGKVRRQRWYRQLHLHVVLKTSDAYVVALKRDLAYQAELEEQVKEAKKLGADFLLVSKS